MKKIKPLVIVLFVVFNSCNKKDSTFNINSSETAKLILVVTREFRPATSTFSDCLTAFNVDGSIAWKRIDLGNGYFETRPYYHNGIIYFLTIASTGNYVYALDPATGSTIWKITNTSQKLVAPSFYKDTLYCGSSGSGNFINAYGINTGNLLSQLPLPNPDQYPVGKIDANVMYIKSSYSTNLTALNLDTKTIKWTRQFNGNPPYDGVNTIDSLVFFPTSSGVIALNKNTGATVWSKTGYNFYFMQVANNLLYLADANNGVLVLNAAGNIVWQNVFIQGSGTGPNLYGNNILVVSTDTSPYYSSLNANTGVINWKKNYTGIYSYFIGIGNIIYALRDKNLNGTASSYIVRIDSQTGAIKDSILVSGDEMSNMSIINSNNEMKYPD